MDGFIITFPTLHEEILAAINYDFVMVEIAVIKMAMSWGLFLALCESHSYWGWYDIVYQRLYWNSEISWERLGYKIYDIIHTYVYVDDAVSFIGS